MLSWYYKVIMITKVTIIFLPIQGLPLTMLKTLSQIAPCLADFFVLGQIQPNSGERRRLAQAL